MNFKMLSYTLHKYKQLFRRAGGSYWTSVNRNFGSFCCPLSSADLTGLLPGFPLETNHPDSGLLR